MDWNLLIAPAAALAGVGLGEWLRGKHQREDLHERRRQEAAAILAPMEALIQDAHPDGLAMFNLQTNREKVVPELHDRWRQHKEGVFRLKVGHPSDEVRDLAGKLIISFGNSLIITVMWMDDLLRGTSTKDKRNDVFEQYRQAKGNFESLAASVRKSP
jgi:hypothetical protein